MGSFVVSLCFDKVTFAQLLLMLSCEVCFTQSFQQLLTAKLYVGSEEVSEVQKCYGPPLSHLTR